MFPCQAQPTYPETESHVEILLLVECVDFYWLKLHRRLLAPFCHEFSVSRGVLPSCTGETKHTGLQIKNWDAGFVTTVTPVACLYRVLQGQLHVESYRIPANCY